MSIIKPIPNSNSICSYLEKKFSVLVPNNDRNLEFNQSFERIKTAIKNRYPTATIEPYGSYGANVALSTRSDIDLCVTITTNNVRKTLNELRDVLEKAGFKRVDVRAINAKQVWGLFGSDTVNHVRFDITLNKLDGLLVTSVVRSVVSSSHPICKQLMILVKDFVKVQEINSAPTGTLSSIAYCFLCIFYLQRVGILPRFDAENFEDDIKGFQPANIPLISDLLCGFFRYYHEFDFTLYAVSVNQSDLVEKQSIGFPHIDASKGLIVIPNPFEKGENISQSITRPGLLKIKDVFDTACKVLENGHVKEVFHPFKFKSKKSEEEKNLKKSKKRQRRQ